jgi:MAF protein
VSKARQAARQASPEAVLLAADTTVVDGEDILGKPVDAEEAESMLRRLRGRTHQVYTALAVLRPADGALLLDCCSTDVPMRYTSDEEIRAYVATGDPLDKAGAYAIQHAGFHPVENLEGCFANVMGMPLCLLSRMLGQMGIEPVADTALACQGALNYACQVSQQFLEKCD